MRSLILAIIFCIVTFVGMHNVCAEARKNFKANPGPGYVLPMTSATLDLSEFSFVYSTVQRTDSNILVRNMETCLWAQFFLKSIIMFNVSSEGNILHGWGSGIRSFQSKPYGLNAFLAKATSHRSKIYLGFDYKFRIMKLFTFEENAADYQAYLGFKYSWFLNDSLLSLNWNTNIRQFEESSFDNQLLLNWKILPSQNGHDISGYAACWLSGTINQFHYPFYSAGVQLKTPQLPIEFVDLYLTVGYVGRFYPHRAPIHSHFLGFGAMWD